jgi:adenosine deaminase CECR1
MGILCSRSQEEVEADTGVATPRKRLISKRRSASVARGPSTSAKFAATIPQDCETDRTAARRLIDAHDTDISSLTVPPSSKRWRGVGEGIDAGFANPDEYFRARGQVLKLEKTLDFDFRCRVRATDLERRVDAILQRLKANDIANVYDVAKHREGFGGQEHKRFPGDHFLSNVDLIDRTTLLDVARRMPKGAHLHIHFNACLEPHVLLDIAKGMNRMFITSDLPLLPDDDYANYEKCEIQFSIKCIGKEGPEGDVFSPNYEPRQMMPFAKFLERFPHEYGRVQGCDADTWLMKKLVFDEREAHNGFQTAAGAWEKFNGRTRMMKGLFNYETAYRKYTRLFLEDLVKNNIQYAEIRPNFMTSNQLFHDDGTGPIDNWGIMSIIVDEVKLFKADLAKQPGSRGLFSGLKVIYCTPRSFAPEMVKAGLDECIAFKQKWPEWIAGFDLVGEEAKGRPLKDFIPEFLQFQQDCAERDLDIPFLFHCGETLDMGTDTDQNLVDALLLNAKRIGHGFALAKHPYIMQHMKARGVCLELCPISNEVLGLTPRVSGHAMYELLANNVHCTVSSDNGTLFR